VVSHQPSGVQSPKEVIDVSSRLLDAHRVPVYQGLGHPAGRSTVEQQPENETTGGVELPVATGAFVKQHHAVAGVRS
jgi:hypothetical protein